MNEQLYRVLKTASGTREFLSDALPLGEAIAHLKSIAENMQANGYLKTDRTSIRKLPVIILAKDMRTVDITPDLRDSRDITIDLGETPTEGIIDNLREGGYPSAEIEVAYV